VPIAGLALVPLILDWPLVLSPVHIVFLELIIDPACSIAFEAEPEETDVMNRPPRNPKEPLFSARKILFSVLQGAFVLLMVLLLFAAALYRGQGEADARALSFTTLVLGMMGLIFANRSWSRNALAILHERNAAFWWVVGGALAFLGTVLYVPHLRDVFRFSVLHPGDLVTCLAAAALGIIWSEFLKLKTFRN
jgi:Ca2+-transporting ATPase